jgi:hypothetical protein
MPIKLKKKCIQFLNIFPFKPQILPYSDKCPCYTHIITSFYISEETQFIFSTWIIFEFEFHVWLKYWKFNYFYNNCGIVKTVFESSKISLVFGSLWKYHIVINAISIQVWRIIMVEHFFINLTLNATVPTIFML